MMRSRKYELGVLGAAGQDTLVCALCMHASCNLAPRCFIRFDGYQLFPLYLYALPDIYPHKTLCFCFYFYTALQYRSGGITVERERAYNIKADVGYR